MSEIATLTATIHATHDDGSTTTFEYNLAHAQGKRPAIITNVEHKYDEPDFWWTPHVPRHLHWTDITIVTGRVDDTTGPEWGRITMTDPPPRGWRRVPAALARMRRRVVELVRREAAE